jgi:hypothetical protein
MRIPYYCPYCDQRSTRRWHLEIHMKRKHGEYLLGRSSDRHMENNPPLYSKSVQFGDAVADSVGDTFLNKENMHLPQQAFLPIPTYRPPPTIHDQSHETGLSQAAVICYSTYKETIVFKQGNTSLSVFLT